MEQAVSLLAIGRLTACSTQRRAQHDIGGLDVAVDKAVVVGVLEATGDLDYDFQRFVPGQQAFALEHLVERIAFAILIAMK